MSLLKVENLTMHYTTRRGEVSAIDGVTFSLEPGASLGLVGESGCGKTSIAMSLLKLLPENASIKNGRIEFDGTDLVGLSEIEMRKVRWTGIAMIFQAAMNSLNPVYKVGDQIVEAIQNHEPEVTVEEARKRVEGLFQKVGLAPGRMNDYPHEYSGGMKQRAIIAMALACNPKLIIADEPTTALDVIVQDRILQEIEGIRKEFNMAMIYISHDIAVIAEVADYMGVMYAGRLVEYGITADLFESPMHPYTAGLMSAFPSIDGEKRELQTIPGEPPNLLAPPKGCRFHPRCPYASEQCRSEVPPYTAKPSSEKNGAQRFAACWHPLLPNKAGEVVGG